MPSVKDMVEVIQDEMRPKDLADLLSELGLTPESLKKDAVALREWVNAEPHLPNLTDEHDPWLESFLLASKNSMEKAKLRLDAYFTKRNQNSEWTVLPSPPKDKVILNQSNFMLSGCLPKLLPGGYMIFMEKVVMPSDGDWSSFDFPIHFRRGALFNDALLGQGRKLRGIVFVLDEQNINMSAITNLMSSIGLLRKLMPYLQDAQPMRIAGIHLVNSKVPNLERMLIAAISPLLGGKLAQRIHVHADYESLHKHIPSEYLPAEYGGSASWTMESINKSCSEFVACRRDWFAARTWMKSDEEKRLVKKQISSDLGVEGSFRKLEFD